MQTYIAYVFLIFGSYIGLAQDTISDANQIRYTPSENVEEENPCYFLGVSHDKKGNITLAQTEPIMVDEVTSALKGRVLEFSLIHSRNTIILSVEIYEDAQKELSPICIGSGSSINFQLKNGTKVTLPQIGEKKCGHRNEVEDEDFYNITNIGFFEIDKENQHKLLNSEVYLGTLKSKTYEFDFVFKSILYDEINDIYIYPEYYFMSELECIINLN
ncbi:MAG: hypothetical protein ACQESK_07245 [Bacteroidota bacterium]